MYDSDYLRAFSKEKNRIRATNVLFLRSFRILTYLVTCTVTVHKIVLGIIDENC